MACSAKPTLQWHISSAMTTVIPCWWRIFLSPVFIMLIKVSETHFKVRVFLDWLIVSKFVCAGWASMMSFINLPHLNWRISREAIKLTVFWYFMGIRCICQVTTSTAIRTHTLTYPFWLPINNGPILSNWTSAKGLVDNIAGTKSSGPRRKRSAKIFAGFFLDKTVFMTGHSLQ